MDAARDIPENTKVGDVEIIDMGRIKFEHAWELQRLTHQNLIAGTGPEKVFLCEHDPVITIGTSGSTSNILIGEAELAQRGVSVFAIERGGDVTYHGPGQLVVYPILDLTSRKRDVHWYMRSLESVILHTLKFWDVHGVQITGKTGVWTIPHRDDTKAEPKKIASIGVRMSRWRTLHGFSLNVRRCTDGFSLIHPCGLPGVEVTSLEEECAITDEGALSRLDKEVKQQVVANLSALLLNVRVSEGVEV